jgi:hypothetical protein
VRALIGIDPCPMAAAIVRATDQEAANASGAHLCKRDFLLAGEFGHAPLKRGTAGCANCPIGWGRNGTETPPVAGKVLKRFARKFGRSRRAYFVILLALKSIRNPRYECADPHRLG